MHHYLDPCIQPVQIKETNPPLTAQSQHLRSPAQQLTWALLKASLISTSLVFLPTHRNTCSPLSRIITSSSARSSCTQTVTWCLCVSCSDSDMHYDACGWAAVSDAVMLVGELQWQWHCDACCELQWQWHTLWCLWVSCSDSDMHYDACGWAAVSDAVMLVGELQWQWHCDACGWAAVTVTLWCLWVSCSGSDTVILLGELQWQWHTLWCLWVSCSDSDIHYDACGWAAVTVTYIMMLVGELQWQWRCDACGWAAVAVTLWCFWVSCSDSDIHYDACGWAAVTVTCIMMLVGELQWQWHCDTCWVAVTVTYIMMLVVGELQWQWYCDASGWAAVIVTYIMMLVGELQWQWHKLWCLWASCSDSDTVMLAVSCSDSDIHYDACCRWAAVTVTLLCLWVSCSDSDTDLCCERAAVTMTLILVVNKLQWSTACSCAHFLVSSIRVPTKPCCINYLAKVKHLPGHWIYDSYTRKRLIPFWSETLQIYIQTYIHTYIYIT